MRTSATSGARLRFFFLFFPSPDFAPAPDPPGALRSTATPPGDGTGPPGPAAGRCGGTGPPGPAAGAGGGTGTGGSVAVEALTADGALNDGALGAETGVPRTVWATAEAGTGAGGELRRGAAGRSARLGAASVSARPTWSAVGLTAGSFDIIRPMRSHRTSGTPSGLPGFIIVCDLSSVVGAPVKGGTPQHIS